MSIVTGVEARKKARNDFQLVFNYQEATKEYVVLNGTALITNILPYNSTIVDESGTNKVITTVSGLNSDTTYYIRVAAVIGGQIDVSSASLTVNMGHESEGVIENQAVYIDDDSIDDMDTKFKATAMPISITTCTATIPVKITDLTVTVNVVAELMDSVHVLNVASVTINPSTEEALVSLRYALVCATLSVNSNIVSTAITLPVSLYADGGAVTSTQENASRRSLDVNLASDAGIVTTATLNSLTDTSKDWATNMLSFYTVRIISGTGVGQLREILSNTTNVITVKNNWAVTPTVGDQYILTGTPECIGEEQGIISGANSTAAGDTSKNWSTNIWSNYNIKIVSGTGVGQLRRISTNDTSTVTISTAWTVTPTIDSTYILIKGYFTALTNVVETVVKYVGASLQTAADWTSLFQQIGAINTCTITVPTALVTSSITLNVATVFASITALSGALTDWGLTTILTPTAGMKARLGYLYINNPVAVDANGYVLMNMAPSSATVTLYPFTLTQYQIFSHSLSAGDKYLEGDVNGLISLYCTPTVTLNWHIEYDEV